MANTLEVAIVGAGFGGLYLSHLLNNVEGKKIRTFEISDEPGGTWNWNRYPGARVDIISQDYSFKFDKGLYDEWNWSERYAPQPELLAYSHHFVRRYNLANVIQYNSTVTDCLWDDIECMWTVKMDVKNGDAVEKQEWKAKWLVLAIGALYLPNWPKIAGLEEFGGDRYHTSRWPREKVDFTGKRVAVIGTGSSAVQSIPVIAEEAAQMTVFQRTPNYSVPANNRALTPEELAATKQDATALRDFAWKNNIGWGVYIDPDNYKNWSEFTPEERKARMEVVLEAGGLFTYLTFKDQLENMEAAQFVADVIRERIRKVVKDQTTAELLCPDFVYGCKRTCADSGYFETYNKPTVKLVSVKSNPIVKVENNCLVLEDGATYGPFDALVCATGFDALTGAASRINIVGKEGKTLKEAWKEFPATYIGLFVSGFPNAMQINGPGSPSVLTNMLNGIEQHDEYVRNVIVKADKEGIRSIDATPEGQAEWQDRVSSYGESTIFGSCNSWYLGSNVSGKRRQVLPWLGGFKAYIDIVDDVLAQGFKGMVVRK